MHKKPTTLVIKEEPVMLTVTTVDETSQKPISGATVTITLPDGKTKTATSNSIGICSFINIPGGEYKIKVSKKYYETKTYSNLVYAPGDMVNCTAMLKFTGELAYVYAEYVTKDSGWRKLGDEWNVNGGADLSNMPKAYIKVEEDGKGNAAVLLRYDRCREDFRIELPRSECLLARVSANEHAKGEYIFRVDIESHSYTSNHSTHYGKWSYDTTTVITKNGEFILQ